MQLTEYNAQCVENSQKQNKQIEQLSRQLAESHNHQQQLLQQIQRLQQQQLQRRSRDDDMKQQPQSSSPTPGLVSRGCQQQLSSTASSVADTDQVC